METLKNFTTTKNITEAFRDGKRRCQLSCIEAIKFLPYHTTTVDRNAKAV